MKIFIRLRNLIAASTLILASQAGAAPILQVENGILTGAQGVAVEGKLYNVRFVDGSCQGLFEGCNSQSDFDFTEARTAMLAAEALLQQVFIDSGAGLFDSDPSKVAGCGLEALCYTFIPYLQAGVENVYAGAVRNMPAQGDSALHMHISSWYDFASDAGSHWARFELAPSAAVPEPGSIALMGLALAGLATLRRRHF